MGIPDDKLAQLKERADIVEVVGDHVALRKSGQGYKGLCPFHREKSPSFSVSPQRRTAHCFGCGWHGDAIAFVQAIESTSFVDAVRTLAAKYGIAIATNERADAAADAAMRERVAMRRVLAAAATHFEAMLRGEHGQNARAYLDARHVPFDIQRTFRLGYAPAPIETGWDGLVRALVAEKLPVAIAVDLGLVAQSDRTGKHYDRFRGRIMFPVMTVSGDVVGFSGRLLPEHEAPDDPAPKYMNSSESRMFAKGSLLFGMHAARQAIRDKRQALLVEGNFDVLALHRVGHANAVAPLGTALTDEQVHVLRRLTGDVVICFDGDAAGRKAAAAALPLFLAEDIDPRIALLPNEMDPASAANSDREALLAMLRSPPSALDARIAKLAQAAGESPQRRAKAIDHLVPMIAQVPRDSARYLYAERIADRFNFPLNRVLRAVEQGVTVEPTKGEKRAAQAPLPSHEVDLVAHVLEHRTLCSELEVVRRHVSDPRLQAILDRLDRTVDLAYGELLDAVDPDARLPVARAIERATIVLDCDPRIVLAGLCSQVEQNLERKAREELDRATWEAQRRGDRAKVQELAQKRMEQARRRLEQRRG